MGSGDPNVGYWVPTDHNRPAVCWWAKESHLWGQSSIHPFEKFRALKRTEKTDAPLQFTIAIENLWVISFHRQ